MIQSSTLNLLERALQKEAETFHTLLTSLSQEDSLEFAFLVSSTKSDTPSHTSEEAADKILLVANNIRNLTNALDDFYVP
jgi:hypothetical protein